MDLFEKKTQSFVISFLGPNRVGKTTMIRSLLSYFGFHKEFENKGPLTVSNNEENRLIFIEGVHVPFSLVNLIKISNIIVIMIDGFFGLELDTFEIINLARMEGVKKIFFVISHLDLFKKWKTLKKIKKRIKERLSKETNNQSRIFFLNGITIKNTYFNTEIANITRFLKNFPLLEKPQYPFLVISRVNFERKKKTNTTCLGYLRGNTNNTKLSPFCFIPGIGFIKIKKVENFPSRQNLKIQKKTSNFFLQNPFFTLELKNSLIKVGENPTKKENFFLFFLSNLELTLKKKSPNNSISVILMDSNKVKHLSLQEFWENETQKKLFLVTKEKKRKEKTPTNRQVLKKKKILKKNDFKYTKDRSLVLIDLGGFPGNSKHYLDLGFPLVISFGLNKEKRKSLTKAKAIRHRWNKITFLSGNLFSISLNWQFFKTKVFFYQIHSKKNRWLLKKSLKPNSSSCLVFFSFIETSGTPLVVFNCNNLYMNYRYQGTFFFILFSGFVLELEKNFKIFRKIKLKGKIFKFFKKTAFIKEMFSSEMQITRFKGALVEQEDGNRGVIKKGSWNGPKGSFRATFAKEIQKKKLVFLKTWISIKLKRFYRPNEFFWIPFDYQEIKNKNFLEDL